VSADLIFPQTLFGEKKICAFAPGESSMLLPLNKIAETLQIDESEALNFAVYFGVPRRHGLYDEREFLLAYIKFLREKIFGVAAVQTATTAPPKISAPRARLIPRKKIPRPKTPWCGVLSQR
jgi:hypothetical protein